LEACEVVELELIMEVQQVEGSLANPRTLVRDFRVSGGLGLPAFPRSAARNLLLHRGCPNPDF
jgi:hypothetical protein